MISLRFFQAGESGPAPLDMQLPRCRRRPTIALTVLPRSCNGVGTPGSLVTSTSSQQSNALQRLSRCVNKAFAASPGPAYAASTREVTRVMISSVWSISSNLSCIAFHGTALELGNEARKCSDNPLTIVTQLSRSDAGFVIEGSSSWKFSAMRLRRKSRNCFGDASESAFWKLGTGKGVEGGMFITVKT